MPIHCFAKIINTIMCIVQLTVAFFFWIDNQRNIINENSKEKYKLFMMMNNRKRIKQTTKKEGNQETNLRENINSKREEQSVKPQHRDHSNRLRWHKTFNSSKVFSVSSKERLFIPTKQSTSSNLESNSKYLKYYSQAIDANKITIPPPFLA